MDGDCQRWDETVHDCVVGQSSVVPTDSGPGSVMFQGFASVFLDWNATLSKHCVTVMLTAWSQHTCCKVQECLCTCWQRPIHGQ